MTRLAVITPSYEPDFGLCEGLSRSVLENSPETVHHHIIVPRRDLELFARLAGPRTHIRCEADFLPSSFVPVPFSKFTVNLRRPFPPVRGWILQQVLKLAAVAAFHDDAVVLVDSDIEFIRPFTPETFVRQGWCGSTANRMLTTNDCRATWFGIGSRARSWGCRPRGRRLTPIMSRLCSPGIRRSFAECFRTFHI